MLNSSFEPVNIVGWRRAVTLLFQGKCEVLEEHQEEIRSISFTMKVPSVIRMLFPSRMKRKVSVKFTRANIFHRDRFMCQYCGGKKETEELTFDHVVPVSQGGKKSWENIVTACVDCNSRKEGRTPEQAKMPLLKKPRQPVWAQVVTVTMGIKKTPETWRDYLYWTVELK
jgi:5-methylcytosine-specific restriction endonuclease McrA